MSGASLLTFLEVVWAAVTVAFVALMTWKTFAGMREDDVVILDELEASQADAQRKLIAKLEKITAYVKGFGLASLVLFVVTGVLWIYRGVTTYSGG